MNNIDKQLVKIEKNLPIGVLLNSLEQADIDFSMESIKESVKAIRDATSGLLESIIK